MQETVGLIVILLVGGLALLSSFSFLFIRSKGLLPSLPLMAGVLPYGLIGWLLYHALLGDGADATLFLSVQLMLTAMLVTLHSQEGGFRRRRPASSPEQDKLDLLDEEKQRTAYETFGSSTRSFSR